MRFSAVQAPTSRLYVVPGPPTRQPQSQLLGYRQSSPTVTRATRSPPRVVQQQCEGRPRRATLATASPDIAPRGTPPRGSPPPRCTPRTVEREAPECSPPGSLLPVPLPSVWRGRYELCLESPTLGGGAFAEVFKVIDRQTTQALAVKVMHRPNFALRGIEKQIGAEISAMRAAADKAARSHAREEGHIVWLLDVAEEHEYVFLLLELCEQGDLLRKLHTTPCLRFDEEAVAFWARQLLLGLRNCHSLGYIHRDIKPDNLLCTSRDVLKLADFGWCTETHEAPTCLAGTFQYMAPEVLRNLPQTEAVDVWSTGVTVHQLLVGKALLATYLGPGATQLSDCDPHAATSMKQRSLLDEIWATCPPAHENRPADVSPQCWDFVRQLLMPEVKDRITVDDALRHPWLNPGAVAEAPTKPIKTQPLGQLTFSPPSWREDGQRVALRELQDHGNQSADDGKRTPETIEFGEPEETGPPREREARLSEVAPRSPVLTRKCTDPRSPSTGRASSIDNVPTPLKPRSWDPARNIAYTPPATGKENDENDETQRDGTPEVSPERKCKLLMSSDRVSTCNASPRDSILENPTPARAPLSRLSPPVPPPQVAYPYRRRSTSSRMIRPEGSPEQVNGDALMRTRLPEDAAAARRPIDPHAATTLLRTLNSCNEQLRQIQAAVLERNPYRPAEDYLVQTHGLVFDGPMGSPERAAGPMGSPYSTVRRFREADVGVSSRGLAPFRLVDGLASSVRMPAVSPDWRANNRGRESAPVPHWPDRHRPAPRCAAAPNVVYRYVATSPQRVPPRLATSPQRVPPRHVAGYPAPGPTWISQPAQPRVMLSATQRWVPAPQLHTAAQVWSQAVPMPAAAPSPIINRRRASAPPVQWAARCA